ncbi:hypothetical protein Rhe02_43770 [Rhizocola hellebori]|uniref:PPIase cyclophilin-type domain-containing protein n=1 Tax=Rhizocola hellebori TaxID=1392758 RepID=A0A8J3VHA7_9ACTN|nr:peptidylprolyl isomerase [Rhizocola hellebori]GIH06310.1 hypothetical protein Rhe02_43770 [Rhizocola hellebori]
MSSTIQRERAAARARLERQMAEKLEKARARKKRSAIAGAAAAVLLVAGGVIWAVVAMGDDDKGPALADGDVSCMWTPDDAQANPDLKEVGAPPTGKAPNTGTQTMTITTNLGAIDVEVNTAKAPCTARSMTYLASKGFFDNTKCHRLVTDGIKVLQCGDPSGTGRGGPTYKMAEENLPNFTDDLKNYPKGTIAMAKTDQPSSTGSQFFIVWGDTPLPGQYTVLGKVTKGLDIVEKVGADGALPEDPTTGATAPKTEVIIKTLTVTPPQEG